MNQVSENANEGVTVEKFRSNFRHDLRSNFSVLIGFGEVLREDLTHANNLTLPLLEETLDTARLALDDTITMINHCSLESLAAFKIDARNGLRKMTLPSLRDIHERLAGLEVTPEGKELLDSMIEAVRELTSHCHSPFEQRLELHTQHLLKEAKVPTDANAAPTRGHVMVIDDEPHNLHLISTFLARLSLSVSTFTRGEDALAALAKGGVDLILLDLHMPHISGLQFLKTIKSQPEYQEIPVLVVTASDDADELANCIEAGAVDSLPKPFQSAFLKARILGSLELQATKKREKAFAAELQYQKDRIEELLTVILPQDIIEELRQKGKVMPRRHQHVCVLFCDIVNFTRSCDTEDPIQILANLQSLFSDFEAISDLHGLQKIKTIGDSFMAAAGLSGHEENPELLAAHAALDMIACAARHESGWQVRVGLHSGPVVSGLVGNKQFLFDIWGDTVNTAARIEGAGKPQHLTVSKVVFERLARHVKGYSLGLVNLKGKGDQEIWVIEEFLRQS